MIHVFCVSSASKTVWFQLLLLTLCMSIRIYWKKERKNALKMLSMCHSFFFFLFCLFFKKSRHTHNKEFQWRITRCLVCFRVHCVRFNLLQELSVAPWLHAFIFFISAPHLLALYLCHSHTNARSVSVRGDRTDLILKENDGTEDSEREQRR